jgi:hypothetical protein
MQIRPGHRSRAFLFSQFSNSNEINDYVITRLVSIMACKSFIFYEQHTSAIFSMT